MLFSFFGWCFCIVYRGNKQEFALRASKMDKKILYFFDKHAITLLWNK